MSAPDRLPEEALDGLLDGSPSEESVGTLAVYLAGLRSNAEATTPAPSAELGAVLAEGLEPAEVEAGGILTSATDGKVQAGILGWRLRGRVLGRVLATKFAALGLLGKAAAAGAAVTVAASGAGAAGVLPEPAQHEFNEIVGRDVQEDPAAPDGAEVVDDDTDAGAESPPEMPADTSTTDPLDTGVPDDATGSSDGEPGVDGRDVAEDASDGASRAPEDGPGQKPGDRRSEGPDDTPAEERRQAPAGADREQDEEAAEEVATRTPPTDAPTTAPPGNDRTDRTDRTADAGAPQGGGEERRTEPSSDLPIENGPRS